MRHMKMLARDDIEDLYMRQGLNVLEVCRQLGVSRPTFYKYLDYWGISRRSGKKRHRGKNPIDGLPPVLQEMHRDAARIQLVHSVLWQEDETPSQISA